MNRAKRRGKTKLIPPISVTDRSSPPPIVCQGVARPAECPAGADLGVSPCVTPRGWGTRALTAERGVGAEPSTQALQAGYISTAA